MHMSGKVLVVFVALAGFAGLVIASRAMDVRNSWLKKFNANRQQIEQNEQKIAEKRVQLANVRAEYDRVMRGWDRYYNGITGQPAGDGAGSLVLGIGPPDLPEPGTEGAAANPIVYAFQVLPEGGSRFLGQFKATRVAAQSSFVPVWRFRTGDDANWKQGNDYRVRTLIPAPEQARLNDLEVQLVIGDELLAQKQEDVQTQDALSKLADEHLALRVGEIEGFPDLQGREEAIGKDAVQGVLKSLVEEEEARNAALAEVNRLERELLLTNRGFESLVRSNSELARQLPHGGPPEPAVGALSP